MIVENESNWRTEDLEALLKSVMDHQDFKLDYGIHDSTLVLFTTNCKKPKKNIYTGEDEEPAAASYIASPKRYEDTKLISIRSSKKLEMELLDKLAHIGDCVQHMNAENVVVLAQSIWVCLSRDYRICADRVSFAKDMNMRTRSKITRSKLAVEKEIAALGWRSHSIRREADRKIRKIDDKVIALEVKLRKMS